MTNLSRETLDGAGVIAAYHELFQVERSFRMAKTDLRARPMFHHQQDSIEAHPSIVFAALAVARHLQEETGFNIQQIVRMLRPLRDVTDNIGGTPVVAVTPAEGDAAVLLSRLDAKDLLQVLAISAERWIPSTYGDGKGSERTPLHLRHPELSWPSTRALRAPRGKSAFRPVRKISSRETAATRLRDAASQRARSRRAFSRSIAHAFAQYSRSRNHVPQFLAY